MVDNKKQRILAVDDSSIILKALGSILDKEYSLITAQDGILAIEKAKNHIPDLILLDIIMRGISGFEVIKILKNINSTKDIPVIFITERKDQESEEKGFNLGAIDYIKKPFTAATVRWRVNMHLQIKNHIEKIENFNYIDSLTGVGNVNYFKFVAVKLWEKAIEDDSPLSFITVNIDKLKEINKDFGIERGDMSLKFVASLIEKIVGKGKTFRWSGKDFVIILANTQLNDAIRLAEECRRTISSTNALFENITLRVTCSFGVGTMIPTIEDDIDIFINEINITMRKLKKISINRVGVLH